MPLALGTLGLPNLLAALSVSLSPASGAPKRGRLYGRLCRLCGVSVSVFNSGSSEDAWDWLRAKISSVALESVAKEEPSSSEEEPNQLRTNNGNVFVLEGFVEKNVCVAGLHRQML